MLSIPSTLSLHRATRALYMDAARRARQRVGDYDLGCVFAFHNKEYKAHQDRALSQELHKNAFWCFLRRARQANWRLVAVKRFAREFETGKQNLLNSDDESVWGDL